MGVETLNGRKELDKVWSASDDPLLHEVILALEDVRSGRQVATGEEARLADTIVEVVDLLQRKYHLNAAQIDAAVELAREKVEHQRLVEEQARD